MLWLGVQFLFIISWLLKVFEFGEFAQLFIVACILSKRMELIHIHMFVH